MIQTRLVIWAVKIQLHKGFGLSGAWGFTFNLKVVGLFRERCRNPPLPLSWSTDSNLSYMVKYVNEIGLPHLYLMWVMLCLKISLVLKFLSGVWKIIEILFPTLWFYCYTILDFNSSRLSITLWTEMAKRGHWSNGIEKTSCIK